ncbi:Uncharacterised protein [Mycobacteroides abscessus subsp. abscessus]|nr:Uncharacterised protein [Mycobacteroides abscessus subsp. abscessus]
MIEALDAVGPHRDRGADRLVLGHLLIDLDVESELLQGDGGAHAAHACTDDDCLHVVFPSTMNRLGPIVASRAARSIVWRRVIVSALASRRPSRSPSFATA